MLVHLLLILYTRIPISLINAKIGILFLNKRPLLYWTSFRLRGFVCRVSFPLHFLGCRIWPVPVHNEL